MQEIPISSAEADNSGVSIYKGRAKQSCTYNVSHSTTAHKSEMVHSVRKLRKVKCTHATTKKMCGVKQKFRSPVSKPIQFDK